MRKWLHTEYADNVRFKSKYYVGNCFRHVRYGTFGKNSIESVHPFFASEQLDAQNLILAGILMTNVKNFSKFGRLGQHQKRWRILTVMEK
jgi:amidophosphoribosyltransferase